jgi:hypothetical protein
LNHKCKGALAFFSFILSFFQFYRCLNYIYAWIWIPHEQELQGASTILY